MFLAILGAVDPVEIALDSPIRPPIGAKETYITLVETEAGRAVLEAEINDDSVTAYLPDGRKAVSKHVPRDRTIRQIAASLVGSRPLRAFRQPSSAIIRPRINHWKAVRTYYVPWSVAIGTIGGSLAALHFRQPIIQLALLAVGILIAVVLVDARKKQNPSRTWDFLEDDVVTPVAALELPPLEEEIEIDDVKAEYGRLLSDLVYRLENPALFDPNEPLTQAFTVALLQWDNNEGIVERDELRELARRVRTTFEVARENAERIGINHVPASARDKATTALKAARLASDQAASEQERATALNRAVAILNELALYFLPSGTDARKAITGHTPLALPGRKL